MEYKKLGRTKLKVSVLGVGGGAFFGENKKPETIKEVLDFSFKNGVNFIETAEDYGEEKLAPALKYLENNGFINKPIIASKSFSSDKKTMGNSIKNSLHKLDIDKIEIYMMHTVDTVDSLNFRIKNGVLDALNEAKSDRLIDWIGISGHRIPTLVEAIKTNEFDVVEAPYCIGATETEKLFDCAKEHEVGVVAIRALGGGILVDRAVPRSVDFMNATNALAYAISNKSVSSVLVGMSSIEHTKENLKAVRLANITDSERKRMEEKVKAFLGEDFCRGCLACMPCDVHGWKFGIDEFLRMRAFFLKYRMINIKSDYEKMPLKADSCVECGKCELRCPYDVPIVNRLKDIHKWLG